MLSLIPTLQIQRELLETPRGAQRFSRYLTAMTGGTDDMVLPLPAFNPMAREHVAAALEELIAIDAEGVAHSCLADLEKLAGDADLRVALVVADDIAGGWTDRESIETTRLREASKAMLDRRWLVVTWWASESVTAARVREEVLAGGHRELRLMRRGPARTLQEMLRIEGESRVFAGARKPTLDEEELAYSREVIAPHLVRDPFEDFSIVFACLHGDEAARRLGHPVLDLPRGAGRALALAEAWARMKTTVEFPIDP